MVNIASEHQTFNLFPLAGTNFAVNFSRLPETTFVAQKVNLPSVSTQIAKQPAPGGTIKHNGDKLEYENLVVEFLVDEELRAYREIYNWLVGTTGAQDRERFVNQFIETQSDMVWTESDLRKTFGRLSSSHASLIITSGSKIPLLNVVFSNIRPVALSQLDFSTTLTDPNAVMTANATFAFDFYEILDIKR